MPSLVSKVQHIVAHPSYIYIQSTYESTCVLIFVDLAQCGSKRPEFSQTWSSLNPALRTSHLFLKPAEAAHTCRLQNAS